ncbi:hypothetical protein DPMN_088661 [Dreissena polymorpha]|uniref:Uncharacterized protein n=1 Tax=Dreissena polymorpha TaxID=45954 RepID=A0A9D4QY32_DREPO|nr:hypothetical protein DPMN_088661 [Dreissena polymorpha]
MGSISEYAFCASCLISSAREEMDSPRRRRRFSNFDSHKVWCLLLLNLWESLDVSVSYSRRSDSDKLMY